MTEYEIQRLKDALWFYADPDNWITYPPDCEGPASQAIGEDKGELARDALRLAEEE